MPTDDNIFFYQIFPTLSHKSATKTKKPKTQTDDGGGEAGEAQGGALHVESS
jgi:hypothetical protein